MFYIKFIKNQEKLNFDLKERMSKIENEQTMTKESIDNLKEQIQNLKIDMIEIKNLLKILEQKK